MRIRQALARALHGIGATTLFGVMGDGTLFMVDVSTISALSGCAPGREVAPAPEIAAFPR